MWTNLNVRVKSEELANIKYFQNNMFYSRYPDRQMPGKYFQNSPLTMWKHISNQELSDSLVNKW